MGSVDNYPQSAIPEVERLRCSVENDWSWNCRRKFIEYHLRHTPSVSLDVLNSYSNVLVNSRILGCKYKPEHMKMIEEMASKAGLDEDLKLSGPTPQIKAVEVNDKRGKGRQNGHASVSRHLEFVPEPASIEPPKVISSRVIEEVSKPPVPSSVTPIMTIKDVIALMAAASTGNTPKTQSPKPFLTSGSHETSSDVDKEVEELTSVVESKSEKDKLLQPVEFFDVSLLSKAAPSGELLIRPSAAAKNAKRALAKQGYLNEPVSDSPPPLPDNGNTPPQALSAQSPLLDDLQLKRINDIIATESSSSGVEEEPLEKSEAVLSRASVEPVVAHVPEKVLEKIKEKAPRNAFLAGLVSRIEITQSDRPSSVSSASVCSKATMTPPPIEASERQNAFTPLASIEPEPVLDETVMLAQSYSRLQSPFVTDEAFKNAIKFLATRPSSELVVRLTGELTVQDSAKNLQETIDANRAAQLIRFLSSSHSHMHTCKIVYANSVLVSTEAPSAKEAKNQSAYTALLLFMRRFPVIQIKASEHAHMEAVSRQSLLSGAAFDLINDTVEEAFRIRHHYKLEHSFGYKLLSKFGWKEGRGLGKHEHGLLHPVAVSSSMTSYAYGRRGLGYSDEDIDRMLISDQADKLFQCFLANSILLNDLVFSNEFSPVERDVIHRAAEKYRLHHHSLGSGANRHLVVRCKFTIRELLVELRRVGGSTGRYQLIEPPSE